MRVFLCFMNLLVVLNPFSKIAMIIHEHSCFWMKWLFVLYWFLFSFDFDVFVPHGTLLVLRLIKYFNQRSGHQLIEKSSDEGGE